MTLTTTAGSNGAWSLTLPTKQIEGQLINVTATDAAGNASGTLGITAPVLPLAARDNITSLDLTSTAVTSTQNYSDYGLLLVGALGNVASVLGNDTAQVEFTIAEGGTGDVTIDAAATGIVLSLLSTQEIVVQRYDTSLGARTTIVNTAVGDFANLLTLTGSGVTLNLSGPGEGQYRVLTYNTSLLATGSYTSPMSMYTRPAQVLLAGQPSVPATSWLMIPRRRAPRSPPSPTPTASVRRSARAAWISRAIRHAAH